MPFEDNNEDLQDDIDLGIGAKEQLLLRILCIRNSNLKKQRYVLATKKHRSKIQTRMHNLIQ